MTDFNVLVLDYGVGNVRSVANAMDRLGYSYRVSGDPGDIASATVIVLPGVGAFAEGMKNLAANGLLDVLQREVIDGGKPVIGICLGMQLFAMESEENGHHQGLGWIDGSVVRLSTTQGLPVPNVGWSDVTINRTTPLFERVSNASAFYFDHSYHFQCGDEFVAARIDYGGEVIAAVQKDNIYGVQFHPEKSQKNGLKLFRGFMESVRQAEEGKK